MPTPALDRVKVVFSGTLAGGEIFSWGFWAVTDQGTTPTGADMNGFCSDLNTYAQASLFGATGIDQLLTNDCSYTTVNSYFYEANTHISSVSGEHACVKVGARSVSGPLQLSMVASLRTGFSGRSNRGRIYLPAMGCPMTAHKFDATETGYGATKIAALLTAINTLTWSPFVSLNAVINSNATGLTPEVVMVETDNRPDIQRRRAARQAITAASQAFV